MEDVRVRDFAVLVAALVVAFVSLQGTGDLAIHANFHLGLDTSHYRNGEFPEIDEHLPLPVITDLDGDGVPEVIVCTREPAVKVLRAARETATHAEVVGAPPPPTEVATASLLTTTRVVAGRRPVGLATGYLDAYVEGQARRQVVVVVTEDWTVLCFSFGHAGLALEWEAVLEHVEGSLSLGALFHREIAISVLPVALRDGDRGAVVVAGSADLRHGHESLLGQALEQEEDGEVWAQGGAHAAGAGADADEAREAARLRAFDKGSVRSDVGSGDAESADLRKWQRWEEREGLIARLNRAKHFSWYALDGGSGRQRWRHTSGDFHEHLPADAEVEAQHQYRMDASARAVHAREADWRVFRRDVLRSLPHRWTAREDTRIAPAHFEKRQRGRAGGRAPQRETAHEHHYLGLSAAALLPHSEAEHVRDPNVLVAHSQRGVEAVHLWTGEPLTHLHLPADGLWHDVNGDGIIDHAVGIGGSGTSGFGAVAGRGGRRAHIRGPACFARVSTGLPARTPLFNGSLCGSAGVADGFAAATSTGAPLAGTAEAAAVNTEIAVPLALDRPSPLSATAHQHALHSRRAGGHPHDTLFLASTGDVTSFSPRGEVNWRARTDCTWGREGDGGWQEGPFRVGLFAMALTGDTVETGDHALAVGRHALSLVDQHGRVPAAHALMDAPVLRPALGDVDGDGVRDVVIVTRRGIDAYRIRRRPVTRAIPVMVGVLVVLVTVAGVSHIGSARLRKRALAGRQARPVRATDA